MSQDEPETVWQREGKRTPTRSQDDSLTVTPADEPPTILQRPPSVLPPRSAEPPTVMQPRPAPGARSERGRQEPGGAGTEILGELAGRFTLQPGPGGDARLGAGAEAEVWLAEDLETHRPVALKIYRPLPQAEAEESFDTGLRERLADPALTQHVPHIYGWGWALDGYRRRVAWEAMEYFPLGSLADLLEREAGTGRPLAADRARELVRAAVDALVFWEDVVHSRQIDLSPGNIMVRQDRPLQLVLSDFGGVRGTGLSQAIGPLQVKVGYMAPEALGNGNDPKSPYWSLGMICYQLVMGRAIIADRDERAFRIILATNDIDVSRVPDPQWRRLIEGLLTRNTEDRWGPAQVRSWLGGGSPGVHRVLRQEQTVKPLAFGGTNYDDRRLLAGAMTVDPDRAAKWLRGGGGAVQLRAWLASNFADRPFDAVHLSGVENNELAAHLAVSRFAATFLPDQRPQYRGSAVDQAGLLRLALDPGSRRFLRQVVDRDVLQVAALHNCSHRECAGAGRCLELESLGPRISAGAAQAMDRLNRLGVRLAADPLAVDLLGAGPLVGQGDLDRMYAQVAEVLLSPEHAARMVGQIRAGRLPRADWWQDLARAATRAKRTTPEGAAAVVVAGEMLDRARQYRVAEDRVRRVQTNQKVSGAFGWLRDQFTRNPNGRQRSFATPRWISRILLLLIVFAAVEPAYWGIARPNGLHRDPSVMQAADQFETAIAPYTGWASDWLTPYLLDLFPAEHWKGIAGYPVLLLIALIMIRRARRGSAVRSWFGLVGMVLGVVVGLGLLMHLVEQEFHVIWGTFATLGVGALGFPLLALITARVLGGRASPA